MKERPIIRQFTLSLCEALGTPPHYEHNPGGRMEITELVQQAWDIAEEKGFHGDPHTLTTRDSTLIRLAMVHSEVSEAVQVVKRHGMEDVARIAEELADVLIGVADLAACLHIDLDAAVQAKLAKNTQRPRQYGTPWEWR